MWDSHLCAPKGRQDVCSKQFGWYLILIPKAISGKEFPARGVSLAQRNAPPKELSEKNCQCLQEHFFKAGKRLIQIVIDDLNIKFIGGV